MISSPDQSFLPSDYFNMYFTALTDSCKLFFHSVLRQSTIYDFEPFFSDYGKTHPPIPEDVVVPSEFHTFLIPFPHTKGVVVLFHHCLMNKEDPRAQAFLSVVGLFRFITRDVTYNFNDSDIYFYIDEPPAGPRLVSQGSAFVAHVDSMSTLVPSTNPPEDLGTLPPV
jgi:hypothetical protein